MFAVRCGKSDLVRQLEVDVDALNKGTKFFHRSLLIFMNIPFLVGTSSFKYVYGHHNGFEMANHAILANYCILSGWIKGTSHAV